MQRAVFVRSMRTSLLALSSLAAWPAHAAPESLPIVVSVGVNRSFDTQLEPLDYAETDAERFAYAMTNVGGVAGSDATLLRSPTVEEFVQTVELMTRSRKRDHASVRLVLYFSGHADDRGLHFRGGPLSRERLHDLLKNVDVPTRIVILDSCFSGSIAAKGVEVDKAFDVPKLDVDELTGSVFLTASAAREAAYESEELSGSIFTHHLIAGLNGAADASSDGVVTVDELYQHVYRETRLRSMTYPGPRIQRPEYHAELHGQGAIIMSRPRQLAGMLEVDPGIMGTVQLASISGLGNFAVYGGGASAREFRIPEGAYRAMIRRGDLVGEAAIMIARGERSVLRPQSFAWHQMDMQVAEVTKGPSRLVTTTMNMMALRRSSGGFKVNGYDVEVAKESFSMVTTRARISTLLFGKVYKDEGRIKGHDFASLGASVGLGLLLTSANSPTRAVLGVHYDREDQYWSEASKGDYEAVELNGSNTAYRRPFSPGAFAGLVTPLAPTTRGRIGLALRGVLKWQQDYFKDMHLLRQYLLGIVVE